MNLSSFLDSIFDLVRYIKATRPGFKFTQMNSGFPNVGVEGPT